MPTEPPEPLITLTAKKDGFFFDFGNSRERKERTIDVEASKSLAQDQELCVTVLGDLLTADSHGGLSHSHVNALAAVDPRNPRLIQLTVTFSPEDTFIPEDTSNPEVTSSPEVTPDSEVGKFASGAYSGTIRLAGVGLEKVDIPIAVTLRSGSQILGPGLAFVVVLLGLVLGYVTKWNSQFGKKLGPATRRNRAIRERLAPWWGHLPEGLIRELDGAGGDLSRWDPDGANAKMDTISEGLEAALISAQTTHRLREEFDKQRKLAAGKTLPVADTILDREEYRLNMVVQKSWPPSVESQSALQDLAQHVAMITLIFGAENPSQFADALRLYALDDFDAATAKAKERPGADAASAAAAVIAPLPETTVPAPRGLPRIPPKRGWLNRIARFVTAPFRAEWWRENVGAVLGFMTALAIAAVGFSSQFLDNPIFGAAGFTDWIALALWGFGAGFAGKTISDYTGASAGTVPG